MIEITPLTGIGEADHGWLHARHHFSFAEYHDPSRMGLGPLRVWNDDLIRAGGGFPMHPHSDMEIITYLRSGAISHEDSLGNAGRTVTGDVQVMSAGTGIVHSEYNREDEDTTLFQIWVYPDKRGYEPRWETRQFPTTERNAKLTVLASGRAQDSGNDALMIHQDAALLCATLSTGQETTHTMGEGRAAYVVPARGDLTINGQLVPERAGVAITEEDAVSIKAESDAEVIIVDVPFPWHPRQVING
ncbi:MAG: pirin family protein [Rhodospirillales bacterium]|jgi:quercetin 2,3-dioxygenase|nr:pirin family protein [Rhodospirillales bacterium]MBT5352322.1 pirin family protein [Rhodospirillales bacterium]MBT6111631.1 pirin family protein [Rhodospirillales bacterium]MBT7147319.1 pirin family protein [Rhodospirillales bacterium]